MLQASQLHLRDWGVIRAQGADATTFLHGQLTQDFALLDREHARLAGFCTAKGRLLATLVGWRGGEDEILLALPAETLAATLKRLSMFVLRAKCKLSDASAEFAVYGLLGTPAAESWTLARDGDAVQIALPGSQRALRVQPAAAPTPAGAAMSPDDWALAEAEAGMAWVRGATVEAFVPQMINFEVLGGVNFKKGCYPGQEIVARSQYRGTLKRRLQVFETDAAATVGQEIFHSADPEQPAGVVAGSGSRDGRSVIAAEIKLAALEGGSLHLGSATGAVLQPRALPYDIPPQE
ncbi:CAF17-like 4Fe-4S cluster assembly/insertion protein YgfZ [Pelomonas aquatica]|jgi:folate-binding protein YgfZ|uniref:Folate-binding protein n=1 Tax=Pelomonas aquatica TaxID=431058 RepID=A0A9X4LD00_9BURK|nr:folate-binding protein [Pelomonas aquatica]MCY4755102.1 folate-binding protein [Pelomonas aquatica]MDG0860883.1 folate-binding protein [Pelomonas aquatica]